MPSLIVDHVEVDSVPAVGPSLIIVPGFTIEISLGDSIVIVDEQGKTLYKNVSDSSELVSGVAKTAIHVESSSTSVSDLTTKVQQKTVSDVLSHIEAIVKDAVKNIDSFLSIEERIRNIAYRVPKDIAGSSTGSTDQNTSGTGSSEGTGAGGSGSSQSDAGGFAKPNKSSGTFAASNNSHGTVARSERSVGVVSGSELDKNARGSTQIDGSTS